MKWLLLVCLLFVAGCAKLPATGGAPTGKRMIISMTMDGEVKENFVYIVALRASNDLQPDSPGPLPVVQSPWGNGFVAGQATHYIQWEPARPRQFVLYRFETPDLLVPVEIGLIENYDEIPADDPNIEQPERKTLRFEVEVNSLAPTPAAANMLQGVQINFLTMEHLGGQPPGNRDFDALGNGDLQQYNLWGEFNLNASAIYTNATQANIEPPVPGDASDPALDLIDWSVEVRLP